ncbi:MAG: hypothetical protein U0670_21200 [Anaerolineae bacterium]
MMSQNLSIKLVTIGRHVSILRPSIPSGYSAAAGNYRRYLSTGDWHHDRRTGGRPDWTDGQFIDIIAYLRWLRVQAQ